jgi:hypothetical protein
VRALAVAPHRGPGSPPGAPSSSAWPTGATRRPRDTAQRGGATRRTWRAFCPELPYKDSNTAGHPPADQKPPPLRWVARRTATHPLVCVRVPLGEPLRAARTSGPAIQEMETQNDFRGRSTLAAS